MSVCNTRLIASNTQDGALRSEIDTKLAQLR